MVLSTFLDNNSKDVEQAIAKKIEDIENRINALEGEVEEQEKVLSNRNVEINKIKAQIKILNKEILVEWSQV